MTTIYRADWSHVTLAEYAALDILKRENVEQLLNDYWDELFSAGKVICAHSETMTEPTRLTPEGSAWLARLHDTAVSSLDERELIAAAREFVKSMGTMLTMNVHRAIR
ncbi:hypothetical protein THIBAULT_199 [Mycobacterium phage Thibault]|uniref:Uncharacterized protein n=1 Tax=Mycobacterium phage Thibault TaxID=1052673 RepID=G1FGR2_9CAUD|nr:hypothetical protein CL87_gp184 [Mycobacterium phage Thibault]AEJ94112.1 hypothetical protein THIBAULT_199 [Mycobacterium phage Thibault]